MVSSVGYVGKLKWKTWVSPICWYFTAHQFILSPVHLISSIIFLFCFSISLFQASLLCSSLLLTDKTDSWMSDGQNKETQMWTIIFPLTHARSTLLSPGSRRVSVDRARWWSRGIGPWKSSHLREGNKMAVAESRFDCGARRRGVWLAVECRQSD